MSDAEAHWRRGKQFDDEGRFEDAMREYRAAAALGHGRAMNSIGYLFDDGKGVERDVAAAVDWFKRAIHEANEPHAMRSLARKLRSGSPEAGLAADRAEAVRLMLTAAECGFALAMHDVGEWLVEDGRKDEGERWFSRAVIALGAEADDPSALVMLGFCHLLGRGVEKDDAQAAALFTKAAVEFGDADAMCSLAFVLLRGLGGLARDEAQANAWFERAAKLGSAPAMAGLALSFQTGRGVDKDPAQAALWWIRARRAGDEDASARLAQLPPNVVAEAEAKVAAAVAPSAAAAAASTDDDSALARALHELDESRDKAAASAKEASLLRMQVDMMRAMLNGALADARALRAQLNAHKREQSVVVPTEIDALLLQFGAVKEEIGRGAAAAVYAAELRGEPVAVKEMRGKLVAVRKAAVQELAIARRLMGHANIVTTYGVVQRADRLCLVMERLALTLAEALHGSKRSNAVAMTNPQRLFIAHGVAAGLRFCHAQTPSILHRDLKPGNVLLSADLRTVKLCDFGSARALADAAMTLCVGTVQYTAPEVLNPPEGGPAQYDGKVDVFSFGVLLWELFAVAKPYAHLPAVGVAMSVCSRGVRPSPDPASLPAPLTALMKRCWAADPQQRPAMPHVVASVGQELQRADEVAREAAAARNECSICFDVQRSVAFVPCGHVCCCNDCAEGVPQCPVCRSVVQERLRVFHV